MMAKGSCMQHVEKIKQGCGKKIRDFARELGKTWPTVFCFFAKRVVIIMYIKIYKMSLLLSLYHVRPLRKKTKTVCFPTIPRSSSFSSVLCGKFLSESSKNSFRPPKWEGHNLDCKHCVHRRLRWWLCLLDHRNAPGEAMGACRLRNVIFHFLGRGLSWSHEVMMGWMGLKFLFCEQLEQTKNADLDFEDATLGSPPKSLGFFSSSQFSNPSNKRKKNPSHKCPFLNTWISRFFFWVWSGILFMDPFFFQSFPFAGSLALDHDAYVPGDDKGGVLGERAPGA